MNRKLITILFIAVFLTACVSFVSAADDIKTQDISVKLILDGQGNNLDKVTVNLLKDNHVVDTAVLSKSNSWSTIFKNQENDGQYSIKVNNDTTHSFQIKGNAENGFIITEKVIEDNVLGIDDETTVDDLLNQEIPSTDNEDNLTEGESEDANPTTADDGTTSAEDEETNSTGDDNSTSNSTDNSTSTDDSDDASKDKNSTTKKTVTTKETVKTKIVKHYKKNKPKNDTKHDMKKTGLPIALVLVAMIAIFVPIVRKK